MTGLPRKNQINIGICPVWSVFAEHSMGCKGAKVSTCRQWKLIRLGRCPGWSECAGCTCHFVDFFHVKRIRASADMTSSFNPSDRFQQEKRKFYLFVVVFLFRLNVSFNNLSVISRRCLNVTGSSMLTLRVLLHWHITSQTHDATFHRVTFFWPRTDQFRFLNADPKRKSS